MINMHNTVSGTGSLPHSADETLAHVRQLSQSAPPIKGCSMPANTAQHSGGDRCTSNHVTILAVSLVLCSGIVVMCHRRAGRRDSVAQHDRHACTRNRLAKLAMPLVMHFTLMVCTTSQGLQQSKK